VNTLTALVATVVLLGLSALFSGLTLGLLSYSIDELRRKAKLGDATAQLVYPLRARGHELLIALIVGNVLVNSALTVLLVRLLPDEGYLMPLVAVISATVLITIFGEILPQAYLRRHGLRFGAALAPYLKIWMNILRPIAKPLSDFIVRAMGKDKASIYSNDELLHILEDHVASDESEIEADELRIVKSALEFGDKLVDDVMTPKSMVVAVEASEQITTGLLSELQRSGHSRIPVYEESLDSVIGVLYMRDLVGHVKDDLTTSVAAQTPVHFVQDQQQLDHVLNAFLKTRNHLFVVVNEFEETVGVVTIEDILEEIIGREIVDEFDKFDDLRAVAQLEAKERRQARDLPTSKSKSGKKAN